MDEIDLAKLSERLEIRKERFLVQAGDVGAVVIDVGDELDGAVHGNALALEVLAQRAEEAEADFLHEDVQHVLVRAADQHACVCFDHLDDLVRGLAESDIYDAGGPAAGSVGAGVEVGRGLRGGQDVFDLVDEDVDALVEPGRDALVEHLFEMLLFFDRGVEEVVAVDQFGGYEFLAVEDVDHLLDQVADVDELEERY